MHIARFRVLCAITLVMFFVSTAPAKSQCGAYSIGANKFDLLQQYLGRSGGGDGSPAYTTVTRAMAQKALRDAARIGITYFRISAMGYAPVVPSDYGDLSLWLRNPNEYWRAIDEMFSDLQSINGRVIPVFLWNWTQIPSITTEPFGEMLTNIHSSSWRLLARYVSEFIVRYRRHPALYFYELSNELNLLADLDNQTRCKARTNEAKRCALETNFTTAEMIAFETRLANLIRSLDPDHKISTGFSMPRENAAHLSKRPEWSPRGADWTLDSLDEFEGNLREIHMPVDIVSVHLYDFNSKRFELSDENDADIIPILQTATSRIGKPLFIGEFGQADVRSSGPNSYIYRMISEIVKRKVMYSAVWVWELYQSSTDAPYSTPASSYSLEPGYTDQLIDTISSANTCNERVVTPHQRALAEQLPQVVITKPLKCAEVTAGSEVFAIASGDDARDHTLYFYVNGVSISSIAAPPYRFSFPPIDNLDASTAIVEVKMCLRAGQCQSYRTPVIVHASKTSLANCLSSTVANPW